MYSHLCVHIPALYDARNFHRGHDPLHHGGLSTRASGDIRSCVRISHGKTCHERMHHDVVDRRDDNLPPQMDYEHDDLRDELEHVCD